MPSLWPVNFDNLSTDHENNVDEIISAAHVNTIAEAVNAMQQEEGVVPSGGYATVRQRLEAIEGASISTHGDSVHDSTVASLSSGKVPTAELGGAGADNTKFLRGDQTWQVVSGSGTNAYRVAPAPSGGDDRTVLQAEINTVETSKETLLLRAGTYLVSSPGLVIDSPYVNILGMGRDATVLKKTANCDLVTFKGSSSLNHIKRCSIKNMTLHGGDTFTGQLLKLGWTGEFVGEDLYLWGNPDIGLKGIELWDSHFNRVVTVWVSGNDGTKPAWHFLNADTGWSGTDNTNMIRITNCHWESFKDGACWIEHGPSNTNNPNGFWFDKCKMESIQARGPFLTMDGWTRNLRVQNHYFSLGGLDSGYAGPIPYIVGWYGAGEMSMRDCLFHRFGGTHDRWIDWWPAGGQHHWEMLTFKNDSVGPVTACIKFSGAVTEQLSRRNIRSMTSHTLTNGTIPPSPTDF